MLIEQKLCETRRLKYIYEKSAREKTTESEQHNTQSWQLALLYINPYLIHQAKPLVVVRIFQKFSSLGLMN